MDVVPRQLPEALTVPRWEGSLASIGELANRIAQTRGRTVLGVAGTPGSGKSTLCANLAQVAGPDAVVVEMDGFHLDDAQLTRLGRRERKGAPDTFDIEGYVVLLQSFRDAPGEIVHAPMFDRRTEASVPDAITITPRHRLIITEGNYLLLNRPGWSQVRDLLDVAWFLDVDSAVRRKRLVARRVASGADPSDALDWVRGVDEPNAEIIETTKHSADLVITLNDISDTCAPKDREA